jgi:hypothetical protein
MASSSPLHVSDIEFTNGQLERNTTYKEDAYDRMCGIANYKNDATIATALKARATAMCRQKGLSMAEYERQYTQGLTISQRVPTYKIGYTNPDTGLRNFGHRSTRLQIINLQQIAKQRVVAWAERSGKSWSKTNEMKKAASQLAKENYEVMNPDKYFEYNLPYPHQAHHIIPICAFYTDAWYNAVSEEEVVVYRFFVACSGYNINDSCNIIYLPQPKEGSEWICKIHNLPDHSSGHNIYNEKVTDMLMDVYDIIEEAFEEVDCENQKNYLEQVLQELQDIQSDLDAALQSCGPVPIGSAI